MSITSEWNARMVVVGGNLNQLFNSLKNSGLYMEVYFDNHANNPKNAYDQGLIIVRTEEDVINDCRYLVQYMKPEKDCGRDTIDGGYFEVVKNAFIGCNFTIEDDEEVYQGIKDKDVMFVSCHDKSILEVAAAGIPARCFIKTAIMDLDGTSYKRFIK